MLFVYFYLLLRVFCTLTFFHFSLPLFLLNYSSSSSHFFITISLLASRHDLFISIFFIYFVLFVFVFPFSFLLFFFSFDIIFPSVLSLNFFFISPHLITKVFPLPLFLLPYFLPSLLHIFTLPPVTKPSLPRPFIPFHIPFFHTPSSQAHTPPSLPHLIIFSHLSHHLPLTILHLPRPFYASPPSCLTHLGTGVPQGGAGSHCLQEVDDKERLEVAVCCEARQRKWSPREGGRKNGYRERGEIKRERKRGRWDESTIGKC